MPTDKQIEAAAAVLMQYGLNAPEQQIYKAARAALAAADVPESANLLSIIADIREKSGVGSKPMLNELADAIGERVKLRIKPLEWVEIGGPNGTWWSAKNPIGGLHYEAGTREERERREADYEALIQSALTTEGER